LAQLNLVIASGGVGGASGAALNTLSCYWPDSFNPFKAWTKQLFATCFAGLLRRQRAAVAAAPAL